MSSQSSYPPSSIDFQPSVVHAAIAVIAAASSIAVLLVIPATAVFDDLAILLTLFSMRRAVAHALHRGVVPVRLVSQADGRWVLVLSDERRVDVVWCPGMLHSATLVAGSMRGEGRRYWILATPWNSLAGPRRRLAARLRWTPAQDLWEG